MAAQSDGSALVVGSTQGAAPIRAQIVRYTPDGSVDHSFSGESSLSQLATPEPALNSVARDVAITEDDRIVVALGVYSAEASTTRIVRLLADGSPDPTFGAAGGVDVDLQGSQELVIERSGRLVVLAASGVARLHPNGALDLSFADEGIQESLPQTASALAVADDGSIYVAGQGRPSIEAAQHAITRLTESGAIDPGFASGGTLRFPGQSLYQSVTSVAAAPDGAAIVGTTGCTGALLGPGGGPGVCTTAVLRVLRSGQIDAGFDARLGITGKLGASVQLDHGGRILIAGDAAPGRRYPSAFALARVRADGARDPAFGVDGIAYGYLGFGGGTASAAVPTIGQELLVLSEDRLLRFKAGPGRGDADADRRPDAKDRCDLFAARKRSGCPSVDRQVRLVPSQRARGLAVRIRAALEACTRLERVFLMHAVRGPDRIVSSRTTNEWTRKAEFPRLGRGRYYGAVRAHLERGLGRCGAARSLTVRIPRQAEINQP